jgi:hypothetical protein
VAVQAPSICDNCGTIFPSGFAFGEGGGATLIFNKAGPCPNCGGLGTIPDGLYEFVGDTLNIVSSWTPERIQRLVAGLETARNGPNPRAATEAVIAENEDLLEVASRLLIPRDAGEFWAFVAALLALLMLLSASQTDPNITVNEQTVIENVVSNPTVSTPKPPPDRSH